jgi:hypothetical protein
MPGHGKHGRLPTRSERSFNESAMQALTEKRLEAISKPHQTPNGSVGRLRGIPHLIL